MAHPWSALRCVQKPQGDGHEVRPGPRRAIKQHGLRPEKKPDKPRRGKVKSKGIRSTHITVVAESFEVPHLIQHQPDFVRSSSEAESASSTGVIAVGLDALGIHPRAPFGGGRLRLRFQHQCGSRVQHFHQEPVGQPLVLVGIGSTQHVQTQVGPLFGIGQQLPASLSWAA